MNEQRNLILALVLSAAVFLGWVLISDRYFPTANKPATQIVKGKTVALPSATPVPNSPTATRDRNMVLARKPAREDRRRRCWPARSTSRVRRLDDLVLTTQRETIAKDSPPVRLFSPDGTGDAYFAGFGWNGQGVTLPDANTMWTATGDVLAPGKPVTLTWNNGQRPGFRDQAFGR